MDFLSVNEEITEKTTILTHYGLVKLSSAWGRIQTRKEI
jgi:hypothetical protein